MGVSAITCYVLICDGCGEDLIYDDCRPHHDTPDPLEADGREFGWTTDDRGAWHCSDCPPLVGEEAVPVISGQLNFEGEEEPCPVIPAESSPGERPALRLVCGSETA
jgi:hypothetical protein